MNWKEVRARVFSYQHDTETLSVTTPTPQQQQQLMATSRLGREAQVLKATVVACTPPPAFLLSSLSSRCKQGRHFVFMMNHQHPVCWFKGIRLLSSSSHQGTHRPDPSPSHKQAHPAVGDTCGEFRKTGHRTKTT